MSATNILREREHIMSKRLQAWDSKTGRFMKFRVGKHTDLYRGIDATYTPIDMYISMSARGQARLDFDAECAFLTMTDKWAA